MILLLLSSDLPVCWHWHCHLLVTQYRGTDPAKEKAFLKKGITAELPELAREGRTMGAPALNQFELL